MSNIIQNSENNYLESEKTEDDKAIELALVKNDLSKLSPQARVKFYNNLCERMGLNPLTQPFGYIEFKGGKLSLYALKNCTDQLRQIHGISIEITAKSKLDDLYIIAVKATNKHGRADEDMGTVAIAGLKGEALGNAMLKAVTKAKRRVTLSICGMGMLDETEVESIPDATKVSFKDVTPEESDNDKKEISEEKKEKESEIKQVINHTSKNNFETFTIKKGQYIGKKFSQINLIDLKTFVEKISYSYNHENPEHYEFFENYNAFLRSRGEPVDNMHNRFVEGKI